VWSPHITTTQRFLRLASSSFGAQLQHLSPHSTKSLTTFLPHSLHINAKKIGTDYNAPSLTSHSDAMDVTFADKVCKLCLSYYAKLPPKGKPASHEWTILACFVIHDSSTNGIYF
jgi:hypothetical protein